MAAAMMPGTLDYNTAVLPTPQVAPQNPMTPATPVPAATPYGPFTAPDPNAIANSPAFQFRLSQGTKAIDRGAAARGTLLTPGTSLALQKYGQGLASDEYGNEFDRSLRGYEANRGTNAQNYGQTTSTYDRAYASGRDAYRDAKDTAAQTADVVNANSAATDAYRRQMADYLAAQQAAQPLIPVQPPVNPFRRTGPSFGPARVAA